MWWCPKSRWSSWCIYSIKSQQKWTGDEKVMAPWSRGGRLYRKFSIKQLITYSRNLYKSPKYYSIAFRVTSWFVELKMVMSEQFKSLNLNQKKMRKLCTDEVGGVKMKKNEKKTAFCNSKSCSFFTALFWLLFWLCSSKMICRAWEGAPVTFLNHSKWRRIEKDLPKCSVIG